MRAGTAQPFWVGVSVGLGEPVHAVDALTADPSGLTPAAMAGVLALTPAALVVGYGLARAGASFCNELRNAVFAKVGGAGRLSNKRGEAPGRRDR